jgi:hypothetical protein
MDTELQTAGCPQQIKDLSDIGAGRQQNNQRRMMLSTSNQ